MRPSGSSKTGARVGDVSRDGIKKKKRKEKEKERPKKKKGLAKVIAPRSRSSGEGIKRD